MKHFQFRNALKSEKAGIALWLKFSDITTDTLLAKLQHLLHDDKFSQRAKQASAVFRDQPIHPMDNAIFHIEYVMRHKGTSYLKSTATELSWYQHLLLDVLALFLAAALILIITLRIIVKSIVRLVCGRKPPKLKSS